MFLELPYVLTFLVDVAFATKLPKIRDIGLSPNEQLIGGLQ
jgi:hypothetical protein